MKSVIRINYIFWKEGPLLPGLLVAALALRWWDRYVEDGLGRWAVGERARCRASTTGDRGGGHVLAVLPQGALPQGVLPRRAGHACW